MKIGIDPGRTTGVAVLKDNTFDLYSFDFWETIEFLKNNVSEDVKVYLEDPNQNKPVFPRSGASKLVMLSIGQKVGMNKRDAQLLDEFIGKMDCDLRLIKPTTKKLSHEEFKLFSGYTGRTNQHQRDAAKLIIGR